VTVFLKIAAVLLLVAGNAFFVAAEYALVTARRTGLVELAREGNRRARIALRIMDDPVRFIGTVQLGITASPSPSARSASRSSSTSSTRRWRRPSPSSSPLPS